MIYRFWEWYDNLNGRRDNLRFTLFLVLIMPFIVGISFPRGSTLVPVGLGWACLLIVTRIYYTVRRQMDRETRREHGNRNPRQ